MATQIADAPLIIGFETFKNPKVPSLALIHVTGSDGVVRMFYTNRRGLEKISEKCLSTINDIVETN